MKSYAEALRPIYIEATAIIKNGDVIFSGLQESEEKAKTPVTVFSGIKDFTNNIYKFNNHNMLNNLVRINIYNFISADFIKSVLAGETKLDFNLATEVNKVYGERVNFTNVFQLDETFDCAYESMDALINKHFSAWTTRSGKTKPWSYVTQNAEPSNCLRVLRNINDRTISYYGTATIGDRTVAIEEKSYVEINN